MKYMDEKNKHYKEAVEIMARAFVRSGELRALKELAKQWPMSVYPDALKKAHEDIMVIAGPIHHPNPRKG